MTPLDQELAQGDGRWQKLKKARSFSEFSAKILREQIAHEIGQRAGMVFWYLSDDMAGNIAAVQPDRTKSPFYDTSIENRCVSIHTTSLGEALGGVTDTPTVLPSRMNPDHVVVTLPAHHEGEVVGGLQVAYPTDAEPSESEVARIKNRQATVDMLGLLACMKDQQLGISLVEALELDFPTTPNAFVANIDTVNSTAQSDHIRTLRSYLKDMRATIASVFPNIADHQLTGDGVIMPIWLPPDIDPNDPRAIKIFFESTVQPSLDELTRRLNDLSADQYPDITPQHTMTLGLGYVGKASGRDLTGKDYWTTSKIKHETPDIPGLILTDQAQKVLDPSS